MNKENNRSAAGLRRSAIAERIRLREEWSELKGISDQPLTTSNSQKQILMKKRPVKYGHAKPQSEHSQRSKVINTRSCHKSEVSEVLMGVVALVEVGSEPRALPLRAALSALGATVVPAWTPIVTHVVWSQGGCRSTRARARALASRIVSPLWVEACASAGVRLPEQTFPAAARPSDLPSPRTLRQLLKKAELENIPLLDLLPAKENEGKSGRLRLSSETEHDTSADSTTDQSRDKSTDTSRDQTVDKSHDKTADKSHDKTADKSHDKTVDKSHDKTESRVNTAPRRALPISISPPRPTKSRRKLFTNREGDVTRNKGLDRESDQSDEGRVAVTRVKVPKPSARERRELARAERMAKRLVAACGPATARAPADTHATQPRIVLTGMTGTERRTVTEAIRSLNGRIQSRVTKSTTHVLLGSCQQSPATGNNSGNQCNNSGDNVVHRSDIIKARTLNALLGAARGARVLYARWAIESATRGQWLHHHEYIVPHLKKISEKARIERTALGRVHSEYAYDVFNGMRVKISPEAEQKDAATQLLKLCGGFVQDGGTQQNGGHDLTIGVGDGEVSSKWVFDSVAAARMRTTRRYVNNAICNTFVTQTTDR